ncbi:hypothetical protein DFH29DRAFT_116396 [Suillus ampliporus]|nr:hypothetical protein DFH29DRAFT_116396 [Suillus ampliporus]
MHAGQATTIIPSYPLDMTCPPPFIPPHQNCFDLNVYKKSSLQYYMDHVFRIQYLDADRSIETLIQNLIHSSDEARDSEVVCLIANLHRESTQDGSIGYNTPKDHDVYKRMRMVTKPITEGEAFVCLCMASYLIFSGGQGHWKAFLDDSACRFSVNFLKRKYPSPDWALMFCTDNMRFIIKTSMWYDVLPSAALIRRPIFLEVLRSLYGPTAPNNGRPELSVMGITRTLVLYK